MAETKAVPDSGSLKDLSLQLIWGQFGDIPLTPVEHAQLQRLNDAIYLTFGQVTVPVGFDPTSGAALTISPVVRLLLTPEMFEKLATGLAQQLANMKEQI